MVATTIDNSYRCPKCGEEPSYARQHKAGDCKHNFPHTHYWCKDEHDWVADPVDPSDPVHG